MNLNAKLLFIATVVATCPLQAELLRDAQGVWKITTTKPTDLPTDPEKRAAIIDNLNQGTQEFDAGNFGAAISTLGDVIDDAGDTEAGAPARHFRAKAYNERGQYEPAIEDLKWVATRRIDYADFNQVIDLEFAIGLHLAKGGRRWLGGWMPWFQDRALALNVFLDVARQAPNGKRAETALIEYARLALKLDKREEAMDALERIVGEHPNSPHIAEAMGMLADLRASDSPGAAWDQASAREAIDALETLMAQYPNSPEAKLAEPRVKLLRDQMARARLDLAEFYWVRRNNPRAARLMAASAITIAPESEAGVAANKLIASIDAGGEPPPTLADAVLGRYPRPQGAGPATTKATNADSELGFKEETKKGGER